MIKHYKNSFQANRSMGAAYLKNNKYEPAIAMFLNARRIEPNNFLSYMDIAEAYIKQGRIMSAIDEYKKAGIVDKAQDVSQNQLCILYAATGMQAEAGNCFEKMLKRNPDDPDASHNFKLFSGKL